MSIKTYTPEVTLSGTVSVERVCSFCKKSWKAQVKINATGRGDSSLFSPDEKEVIRAREKAAQQLKQEEEKAKKQVDRGVLCPSCKHFSSDAMAKHFPNGFLAGLEKKFRKAMVIAILAMLACGLGAFVFGGAVLFGGPTKDDETAVVIIFGILALLLLAGFIYNLVMGIRLIAGAKRVGKHLKDKNDDDLLEIAVSQYRANKESLAGTYNWGTMLLDRSKPA